MANSPISSWTEQQLANITAAGTSDFVGGTNTTNNNTQNRKFSLATLANFAVTKFKPSALSSIADGSVTGAIALLDSKTGAGAGYHNSIYRGKNLGNAVTSAQWTAISSGTFEDLFIGDYWVINSVTWRIAAFDYWYNTGDTNCTTHHVVIVPDSNLLNGDGSTTHWMNTSNITTGGYMGTGFYTGTNADSTSNTGKSQCLTKIESAFGSSHILSHREYFSNAVSDGYVSGGTWADSKVDLMNETMVYGNKFFENAINGTNVPAAYTIDKTQLPLFALEPSRISNRADWWLRSVVSSSTFAVVNGHGYANCNDASYAWTGVRPAFGIK